MIWNTANVDSRALAKAESHHTASQKLGAQYGGNPVASEEDYWLDSVHMEQKNN